MKTPIRILLYFAVWGRHAALRVCLEGVKRLMSYDPERFQIIPFAVCSTPEDAAVLSEYGITHCTFENTYLGAKKNFGLQRALELIDFDYMLEIGSDDLIANKLLDIYEPYMLQKALMLSVDTCYFIETATGRTAYWTTDLILGGARAIHVSLLEKMNKVEFRFTQSIGGIDFDYRAKQVVLMAVNSAENYEKWNYGTCTGNKGFFLWNHEIQSGLDTNSHQRLIHETGATDTQIKTTEPLIVDLKTGENINGFGKLISCDMPVTELLKHFGATEAKMILKLINPKPAKTKKCRPANSISS